MAGVNPNIRGGALNFLRRHPAMVVVFVVAVGLRLTLLLLSLQQNEANFLFKAAPDTINYVSIAQDLVHGTNLNPRASFSFPPGYPAFIALHLFLFGDRSVPIVLSQILLSSITCLLIFGLAKRLFDSAPIATVSGLLAATSFTSISLSCILLSDCLYHFLFALSLWLFLKGQDTGQWRCFVISGLLSGYATLVRPIGQMWPVMMMLIAVLYPLVLKQQLGSLRSLTWSGRLLRSAVSATIAVIFIIPWIVRNSVIHGIMALAFTSAGGPANIAALAEGSIESKSRVEIQEQWANNYMREHHTDRISIEENYLIYRNETGRVLHSHPWQMLREYLALTWENLTDLNYVDRALVPHFKQTSIGLSKWIKIHYANFLNVALCAIGLIVLVFRKQWLALLLLGLVYCYCAGSIGFYLWQGSRYFLPGLTAWAILISVVLCSAYSKVAGLCARLRPKEEHAANNLA